MQTKFTLSQLADPDLQEANKILRACVHCGFCTATCPTYVLLGDELDSPRGRIYLIKEMLESGEPAGKEVAKHIDRCLSCLSCMTTCPSGVHYMHLVDHARVRIEETYYRPWHERLLRRMVATVLPRPTLFRLALFGAGLLRPIAGLVPGRWGGLLRFAPRGLPGPSPLDHAGVFPAEGVRRKRVALLAGCAQRVLAPEINEATIRLLNRLGVEVVVAKEAGCCGALSHHMGEDHTALEFAKRNIDAWLGLGDLDAIVVNASGCGTVVKDYGYMLRKDAAWAACAARRLSLGLLDAARPKDQGGAEASSCRGRVLGRRSAGGSSLLRLRGHVQPLPAGARDATEGPQDRQHRDDAAGRRGHREHRVHHADPVGHDDPRRAYGRASRLGDGRPEATRAREAAKEAGRCGSRTRDILIRRSRFSTNASSAIG